MYELNHEIEVAWELPAGPEPSEMTLTAALLRMLLDDDEDAVQQALAERQHLDVRRSAST